MALSILIIEDEPALALLESKAIEQDGVTARTAESGAEGLRALEDGTFDIVLLDYHLPDVNGAEVLTEIIARFPETPVIMVTGHGDERLAVEVMKAGAKDYIVKDFESKFLKDLPTIISRCYEKHLLEKKLKESEDRYRLLVEGGFLIAGELDLDTWSFIFVSHQAGVLVGYPVNKWCTPGFWKDHLHPDDKDEAIEFCQSAAQEGGDHTFEYRMIAADGRTVWFRYFVSVVKSSGNETARLRGFLLDVTDRKDAAEELRLQGEIASNMAEGVFLIRASDEHIVYTNPRFDEMFGYERGELVGKHVSVVNAPTEHSPRDTAREILKLLEEKGMWRGEVLNIKKDGEHFWNHAAVSTFDHSIYGTVWVSVHTDITGRKRAENKVLEQRNLFRSMLIASPDRIVLKDRNGKYMAVNPAFCAFVGQPEDQIIGKTDFDCFLSSEAEIQERDDAAVMNCGITQAHDQEVKGGAEVMWLHIIKTPVNDETGRCLGILCSARDITERVKAEEERRNFAVKVREVQKLESLGVLAGGIAHDFNNLLTSILGNTEIALRRLPASSSSRHNLQEIGKASRLAAGLSGQMLAYSGKGRFVVENISLNEVVEEMAQLIVVSISKNVVLKYDLSPISLVLEADVTQVNQVIMNLIINASEAIGEESGVISIKTGAMDCDKSYLKEIWSAEEIPEGSYVYLEVSDTGCGMDKETVDKVFDPFFTTKFVGRGLGMSAVQGIVRGHKGGIKICSEVDKGTTFKVLFPSSEESVSVSERSVDGNDKWVGEGDVLLVDDEETVRMIGKQMLEEIGFKVVTASDGGEALEIYRTRSREFVFVLLDLTMPLVSGRECFQELRQINRDACIIVTSGFNERDVTREFIGKGLSGFIPKPFDLARMERRIRKAVTKEGE